MNNVNKEIYLCSDLEFEVDNKKQEFNESDDKEYYAVVANVVNIRLKGEMGKKELVKGTKLFRPGAKVYIIDWYPGMCESVVTIGQHRKSRKYINISMTVKWLLNFRLKRVYSPTIIKKIQEHFSHRGNIYNKQFYEELEQKLPFWKFNQGLNTNNKIEKEQLKYSENSLFNTLSQIIKNILKNKEK